jgi:1-acyl-sn-glycerol-3-phosphate acyltransferase
MIAETLSGVCRLLAGTSVEWRCAPEEARPSVYFANHASHLDFVTIWASLPQQIRARVRPVAARDYWEHGLVRRVFSDRVFHALLIDRAGGSRDNARASLAAMAAELEAGRSLIVFPEGTRSRDGAIATFRSGLYYLARACPSVDLVPVLVENTHRVLPKGESVPVPMLTHVVFGSPLHVGEGEDKRTFLARARDALVRLGGCDGRHH